MKTLKSLFMLCAGLSFCACSSDNEPQLPEGEGKVVVKIVSPTTRMITSPTNGANGDNIELTGTYTVTLTASSIDGDAETKTKSITIDADSPTKVAEFSKVVGPSKVTVSLNNGAFNYPSAITSEIGHAGVQNVPAYGETKTFTPETKVDDVVYTATVKMAIPVARLEIGNITVDTEKSEFTKLNVAGVYLDNLRTNGGNYSVDDEGTASYASTESTTNYYFSLEDSDIYGKDDTEENAAPLADSQNGDFFATDSPITTLPTNSQNVFAYNFYGAKPGTQFPNTNDPTTYSYNPQFKICFSESQLKTEGASIPRYAMITTYKSTDNIPIVLENGKIYRVTAAKLKDENIRDDEDGKNVEYSVEVTVEDAVWTIQDINADWY